MSQYRSHVQNMFLSEMRKKHNRVEVILETGTTLRGKLKGYDQYSITLAFKNKLEVIYKSSIIYITPVIPTERRDYRRPNYPSSSGPRYGGYNSRYNDRYDDRYDKKRPSRVPNLFEDED